MSEAAANSGGGGSVAGTYNGWLEAASLFVGFLASFTALEVAVRVYEAEAGRVRWWITGGATAVGVGFWSMHFLGLLAFRAPEQLGYDGRVAALSLVLAIISPAFALWWVSHREFSVRRLCIASAGMGMCISCGHLAGEAAVRVNLGLKYSIGMLLVSVLASVMASAVSLCLLFVLRGKPTLSRVSAAAVISLAFAGVHYAAVLATRYPGSARLSLPQGGPLLRGSLPFSWGARSRCFFWR